MNRAYIYRGQELTDEWFYIDKAICHFRQQECFQDTKIGKILSLVSMCQDLYYSRNGSWIIRIYCTWYHECDNFYYSNDKDAAWWLLMNGYGPDDIQGLPQEVLETILDEMEMLEV